MFYPKKVPRPKCRPQISPEADFGNFSKSLQQWRTANPREILSRIHPSTLQTEPRGEKLIFCTFSCKNRKCGVGNPTFTNYFWDFGPTWDVWCQKPNIYELFSGFWTHLGCLVLETQHVRIIFEILDLHLGCLVLEPIFRENVPKTLTFTRFGSRSEFETGSSQSSQSTG